MVAECGTLNGHSGDLGTRNPASIVGNIHDDSLCAAIQSTPTARLHGSGQHDVQLRHGGRMP
jgi:hypothetical protein